MSPAPATEPSTKPAWVQLYEARRKPQSIEERMPGRPPGLVPRRKVGVTLSQGEIVELQTWQERFSSLLQRKISTGETVGILTRLASARFTSLEPQTFNELSDLVELIVGR
jgi:hypothetical protein